MNLKIIVLKKRMYHIRLVSNFFCLCINHKAKLNLIKIHLKIIMTINLNLFKDIHDGRSNKNYIKLKLPTRQI